MAHVRRSECGVSVWLGDLSWHLVPKYIELLTRIRERDFENFVYEVIISIQFVQAASTPPSRAAPHDSGPMWVATSYSYDFCIHYTLPVLPAHRRNRSMSLCGGLIETQTRCLDCEGFGTVEPESHSPVQP